MSTTTQQVKRGRKPKYTHVVFLKVNAKELYKRLKLAGGIKVVPGEDTENEIPSAKKSPIIPTGNVPEPVTNLNDVLSANNKRQNYFTLGESNKFVVMKDHVDFGCLPDRTDLYCWHDRHPFNSCPIGIPIKYIPKKTIPKFDTVAVEGENDYFLTVGVFCSFPCCLAYLNEHKHETIFRNSSKSLLELLIQKLKDVDRNCISGATNCISNETKLSESEDLVEAASWQCLKEYGGKLSIEELRKNFCSHKYTITENIKRPYTVAVGKWVEEKRCGYL